jgi:hypothetical protein
MAMSSSSGCLRSPHHVNRRLRSMDECQHAKKNEAASGFPLRLIQTDLFVRLVFCGSRCREPWGGSGCRDWIGVP